MSVRRAPQRSSLQIFAESAEEAESGDMDPFKSPPKSPPVENAKDKETLLRALIKKLQRVNGKNTSLAITGDSTMEGLYRVMKKAAEKTGLTLYWRRNDACPSCMDSKCSNDWLLDKKDVTAVAFNYGLHLLHSHPIIPCTGPQTVYPHVECGSYEQVVENAINGFASDQPKAQLFWKTTNSICGDRLKKAEVRSTMQDWHDPVKLSSMLQTVKKECSWKYNSSWPDRRAEDELFDRRSTMLQRDISLRVIKDSGLKVNILDGFAQTDGQCTTCKTRKDGIHYPCVDWNIAIDFVTQVIHNSYVAREKA